MNRRDRVVLVGVGGMVALLAAVPPAHGGPIRVLTCTREMAEKAKGVASAACNAQVGSRGKGPIYVVTLSADEARGGTSRMLRVAESEARRQGLCAAAVDLVAGPAPLGDTGQTELAIRCVTGRETAD